MHSHITTNNLFLKINNQSELNMHNSYFMNGPAINNIPIFVPRNVANKSLDLFLKVNCLINLVKLLSTKGSKAIIPPSNLISVD